MQFRVWLILGGSLTAGIGLGFCSEPLRGTMLLALGTAVCLLGAVQAAAISRLHFRGRDRKILAGLWAIVALFLLLLFLAEVGSLARSLAASGPGRQTSSSSR